MSNLTSRLNSSRQNLRNVRCLGIIAMLVALDTAMTLSGLTIRLSGELRISLGFVCDAIIAALFGPVAAMLSGACSDLLGYFAGNFTMGGYFPGYTLTAICSGFIYGLFLYHPEGLPSSKKIRVLLIVLAKSCVNLFCNVGLNTLWLTMTSGKAMMILLPARIAKNLILLPFECIILVFALQFIWSSQKHILTKFNSTH